MMGVVATADVPSYWHVCDYPGLFVTKEQRDLELSRLQSPEDVVRASDYDMQASYADGDAVLVPADAAGRVLPEFEHNLCPFVNEASSPGEAPNVRAVTDLERNRVSYVTSRPIKQGEELLTWYGRQGGESRGYDVDWVKHANNLQIHSQTRGFIERGNELVVDTPDLTAQGRHVVANLKSVLPGDGDAPFSAPHTVQEWVRRRTREPRKVKSKPRGSARKRAS